MEVFKTDSWPEAIRPCPFMQSQHVDNGTGTSNEELNPLARFGQRFGELHGPLSLALCFFGIPTNLANILVLTRTSMSQSATNHLLFWLAVADLITMLLYVPSLYHFYIVRPNPIRSPMYSPYKLWVIYQTAAASGLIIFHSLALWIAVVLAVFRYLYIGFPTVGPILATKLRAFLSVIILTLCCVVFVIPNALINYVDRCYGTVWIPVRPTLRENMSAKYDVYYSVGFEPYEEDSSLHDVAAWPKKELYAINTWLQASLFKIVPCFLLSVLTVLLVCQMKRAIRRRKALQPTAARKQVKQLLKNNQKDNRNQQHSENRTTTLLLAILLTVLVVELPQGILVLCLQLIENFYVNVYQHLGDFIDFTTLVNESTNFVIYTTMSHQFRQEFCQLFLIDKIRDFVRQKCCTKEERNSKGQENSATLKRLNAPNDICCATSFPL
ncbi:putative G-protein coupled receptor [Fasciola hepatica]|uniref:G-protein coupled receptor n=1 Tax=Fasciola hepatica TaxID=6192 RepID=A0A2H1CFQ9_FASHE|nr:putative G-protein coupled receptor [Fasciola hepatica]